MSIAMKIAAALPTDACAIAAIYALHVQQGTASYEIAPPSADEMSQRMGRVLDSGWPWLVARDAAGAVVGYAYVTQFRDRAAYRFACENSIYICDDQRGRGIGAALLVALIEAATACGFRQMIAVIGGAEPASAALHRRLGFAEAGRMHAIGRKHGCWLDTLYMQLALGAGDTTPPEKEPV